MTAPPLSALIIMPLLCLAVLVLVVLLPINCGVVADGFWSICVRNDSMNVSMV